LVELASAFDEMLGRLEKSFTQLAQFSADLAHELRTPINNLMGEAEVALTRRRGPGGIPERARIEPRGVWQAVTHDRFYRVDRDTYAQPRQFVGSVGIEF